MQSFIWQKMASNTAQVNLLRAITVHILFNARHMKDILKIEKRYSLSCCLKNYILFFRMFVLFFKNKSCLESFLSQTYRYEVCSTHEIPVWTNNANRRNVSYLFINCCTVGTVLCPTNLKIWDSALATFRLLYFEARPARG
jgi:hypothetical protein